MGTYLPILCERILNTSIIVRRTNTTMTTPMMAAISAFISVNGIRKR